MAIPRKKMRKIQRRAERRARRDFRPARRQARQDIRKIKSKRQRDIAGVSGASATIRAALNEAMGEAQDSGLRGRYLRSTLDELQAMKGDARRMVPLQEQAVRQAYASPLATARNNLVGVREQQTAQAQDSYASRITALKKVQADKAAQQREVGKEIKLAVWEGKKIVNQIPESERMDLLSGKPEAWRGLAEMIAKKDGVNNRVAVARAMEELRALMLAKYQSSPAAIGISLGLNAAQKAAGG